MQKAAVATKVHSSRVRLLYIRRLVTVQSTVSPLHRRRDRVFSRSSSARSISSGPKRLVLVWVVLSAMVTVAVRMPGTAHTWASVAPAA